MLYNVHNHNTGQTLVLTHNEAIVMYGTNDVKDAVCGFHPTLTITEEDVQTFLDDTFDDTLGYNDLYPVDMEVCF